MLISCPVSYTHLDVYKRQAYMCRTALFAKRWDIAITAADEIKKLNKYDLMDEYKDVFLSLIHI